MTANFFPRIGLVVCQLWILVAVGALVMVRPFCALSSCHIDTNSNDLNSPTEG